MHAGRLGELRHIAHHILLCAEAELPARCVGEGRGVSLCLNVLKRLQALVSSFSSVVELAHVLTEGLHALFPIP